MILPFIDDTDVFIMKFKEMYIPVSGIDVDIFSRSIFINTNGFGRFPLTDLSFCTEFDKEPIETKFRCKVKLRNVEFTILWNEKEMEVCKYFDKEKI